MATVKIRLPDGQTGTVDEEQLEVALSSGAQVVGPEGQATPAALGLTQRPAPPKPQRIPATGPTSGSAFARGAAQGATLGFADELAGRFRALPALLPGGETFGEASQREIGISRERDVQARGVDPAAFLTGQALTGIPVAGAAIAGAGLLGLGPAATSAIASGTLGGAISAGVSEREGLGLVKDVAKGAITGATIDAALLGAGRLGKGAFAFFKRAKTGLDKGAISFASTNSKALQQATGVDDLAQDILVRVTGTARQEAINTAKEAKRFLSAEPDFIGKDEVRKIIGGFRPTRANAPGAPNKNAALDVFEQALDDFPDSMSQVDLRTIVEDIDEFVFDSQSLASLRGDKELANRLRGTLNEKLKGANAEFDRLMAKSAEQFGSLQEMERFVLNSSGRTITADGTNTKLLRLQKSRDSKLIRILKEHDKAFDLIDEESLVTRGRAASIRDVLESDPNTIQRLSGLADVAIQQAVKRSTLRGGAAPGPIRRGASFLAGGVRPAFAAQVGLPIAEGITGKPPRVTTQTVRPTSVLAQSNPKAFGQFGAQLNQAQQEGEESFGALLLELSETDPRFREKNDREQEKEFERAQRADD